MDDLSKLVVPGKEVVFEYPGLDGFNITLAYLTRDDIQKIRSKAVVKKVSRTTRGVEDEVDSDRFQDLYIKAIVRGWTGLKYKYLPKLLPVDANKFDDPEAEMPYSESNALVLMKNSSNFDGWVSGLIDDVANFTQNS